MPVHVHVKKGPSLCTRTYISDRSSVLSVLSSVSCGECQAQTTPVCVHIRVCRIAPSLHISPLYCRRSSSVACNLDHLEPCILVVVSSFPYLSSRSLYSWSSSSCLSQIWHSVPVALAFVLFDLLKGAIHIMSPDVRLHLWWPTYLILIFTCLSQAFYIPGESSLNLDWVRVPGSRLRVLWVKDHCCLHSDRLFNTHLSEG